ncbi:MAG: hypothetical protein FHP92_12895 [Denitromonas halophila]|nr:MAG: hypothetical protein FHP92_12895 [Denitromonas halophila]
MTDNLFSRRPRARDLQRAASQSLLALLASPDAQDRIDLALLDEAIDLAQAAAVLGMIQISQIRSAATTPDGLEFCIKHLREAVEDELRAVQVSEVQKGGCGQPAGRTARLQRLMTASGPVWECSARSACGSPCSPTDDNRSPRLTKPTQPRWPSL